MNAELFRFLETKLPDAVSLLERMVAINSFTRNAAGVNELGVLTARAFAPLGFEAESVASEHPDHGEHLFLRRRVAGPRVVLVTHLDTVYPPAEETRNQFHWRPERLEGRIYGPGTVDIKGGTVMIWLVLHALAGIAPEFFSTTDWLIAVNSSEEALSVDFSERTIERSSGVADAVLVFEGGALRQPARPSAAASAPLTNEIPRDHEFMLVTGRKGKADYRLSVSGRGAHAGSYHAEGRNAIVALADCLQKAAALTDYARELTVNVGNIRGGTVVNRVPHEAAAELELRAFDTAVFAKAKAQIESLAGGSVVVPGAIISVESLGETAPWPEASETLTLFQRFAAAADLLGARVVPERRGGLSDANYLHVLGPTLDGLGPSGGNAHCSERSADGSKIPEYVEVGSFVPKAALCTLALLSLQR